MKIVYLVEEVDYIYEYAPLCYESTRDIPTWIHKKIKSGIMTLKKLEISEDHYRFNPQAISYFHDVHKIKNSDKFLLITSGPDSTIAVFRTLDQLKEMNEAYSEYYYYRFTEAIEEIEM